MSTIDLYPNFSESSPTFVLLLATWDYVQHPKLCKERWKSELWAAYSHCPLLGSVETSSEDFVMLLSPSHSLLGLLGHVTQVHITN